jgi:hypothetical protein
MIEIAVWGGGKSRRDLALGVGTPVHRGGGRPPGLRRGRPWWWPERRCGVPPSLFAVVPTTSGSRVRLSVFEENWRQPRCTGSHPERMRPHHWPLLEKTPLMLRAHIGSSRVREDLPRRVREVSLSRPSLRESFARPHRHQPCTQVTRLVMRSTEARPRFSSSRDRQRTTPKYSSNRNRSIGISSRARDSFSPGNPRPRGRILRIRFAARRPIGLPRMRGVAPAGPRSRTDLATIAPARGQLAATRNLGGNSLPTVGLPNGAAGESAARVGQPAASTKRALIRATRRMQRWGVRGTPHHPLRWS